MIAGLTSPRNCENCKLLYCDKFEDIRIRYLKEYVPIAKNAGYLYLIDGALTQKTKQVSMYIYYALQRRTELLSTS